MNTVYFCAVTEYESGWGNRPDGYLIAVDRPSIEKKAEKINAHTGAEFSRTEEIRIGIVTDECYARVKNDPSGCIWNLRNDSKDWLVDS